MSNNPTNEQAREIVYADVNIARGQSSERLVERVAAALSSRDAEIREVLEGLATHQIGSRRPCWCPLDYGSEPHTELCKTARALYAKLQPGKEGNDVAVEKG